jgi:hypothetical protein
VKGLLFAQWIRDFDALAPDRLERLAELAILPKLRPSSPANAPAWPGS